MKTETDASMAASDSEHGTCNEDEYSSNSGESDPSRDSDLDPSYSIREDPHAKIWRLSVRRKSKSRIGGGLNMNVDDNEEKVVQKIIEVGQLEKLKVEQCKVYLRKNGLRLTGTKSTLIQRIREHLEVSNGEGDKKYPVSSFDLDCKGASMEASDSEHGTSNEDEYSSNSGKSNPSCDSDLDQSYSILEETHAKFLRLSVGRKSKSSIVGGLNMNVDENEEKVVQKIIGVGQLEKLKVEQCKVYLRKNGLRLTGNKSTLIQRIKEHLEVSNGEGEKKYPVSSFELDCKGDACTGDVVMFEQNVYDMFNIASHSATGPPYGKRIVTGRIVKESYGAAKQQHTFTLSEKPQMF